MKKVVGIYGLTVYNDGSIEIIPSNKPSGHVSNVVAGTDKYCSSGLRYMCDILATYKEVATKHNSIEMYNASECNTYKHAARIKTARMWMREAMVKVAIIHNVKYETVRNKITKEMLVPMEQFVKEADAYALAETSEHADKFGDHMYRLVSRKGEDYEYKVVENMLREFYGCVRG